MATYVTREDLAAPAVLPAYGYGAEEAQSIFDNALPLQNYAALRAYTGRALGLRITSAGIAGTFQRDTSDNTSADNGGTIILDASNRRWKRTYSGALNVRWFGAGANDGVDDTAAFQNALNEARMQKCAVVVPGLPGGYLLDNTSPAIYMDGVVSLIGVGQPLIRVSNGTSKGANKTAIVIGTRERWSGTVSGIHFQEGQGNTSVLLFNVMNADGYSFDNNEFTSFKNTTLVKGQPDADWTTIPSVRRNGKYRGNLIDTTSFVGALQEGFSVSGASRIEMTGNTIIGIGDDPLAFHNVTGGIIANNYCDTINGRIYVSDSVDFKIESNFCTHNVAAVATASLITCTWESSLPAIARGCSNFTVRGNTLRVSALEVSNLEAVYIRGCSNYVISDNTIQSDNTSFRGSINIADLVHQSENRTSSNVVVSGNIINGGTIICTTTLTGGATIANNIVDGKGIFPDLLYLDPTNARYLSVSGNQLVGASGRVQFCPSAVLRDTVRLCSFTGSAIGNAQTQLSIPGSALSTWQSPRDFVITEVSVRTSGTSSGFFNTYLYLDGVLWTAAATATTFSMGGSITYEWNQMRDGETSAAARYMNRYVIPKDTVLRVDFRDTGNTLMNVTVDVYGYLQSR